MMKAKRGASPRLDSLSFNKFYFNNFTSKLRFLVIQRAINSYLGARHFLVISELIKNKSIALGLF